MYKTFILAALFSVAISKKNKKKRAALDFLDTVEDTSNMDIPTCFEECLTGYEQDPDTCACTAAATVPGSCFADEVLDEATCQCTHEVNEPKEARCFYGYRLNPDTCQCEAPAVCSKNDAKCGKDQWFDKWDCSCNDFPTCDTPCELGFKADPITCECIDITVADIKCKRNQFFDQASCTCQKTKNANDTNYKKVKCPKGYEINDDCSACVITNEFLCKPQKCPKGMGWNSLICNCDVPPECPVDTVTKCEKGFKYNPMIC